MRATKLTVSLSAIRDNFALISKIISPAKILSVVKANAYGLGLLPVARTLASVGADLFGVAYVQEGVALRRAGIASDILVMGAPTKEEVQVGIEFDLILTVHSLESLQIIEGLSGEVGKKSRVHLKVDTGMSRLGVTCFHAEELVNAVVKCKQVTCEGVYTHFASAEDDGEKTKLQLDRFQQVIASHTELCSPTLLKPSKCITHAANTAGVLRNLGNTFDYVRTGLGLYGILPNGNFSSEISAQLNLQPTFELVSQVSSFKKIAAGETVSYGGTYTLAKDSNIAVIPIGYGDGFLRTLSNNGRVLIREKYYPIVGVICMDQLMVDLGDDIASIGDLVTLIGVQGNLCITANEIAETVGTTVHEVSTLLNERVERVYV